MSIFDKFFPSDDFEKVGWKTLDSLEGLDEILALSSQKTVIIFKHSIRCGTSAQIKDALFSDWDIDPADAELYYLDLINHRQVSNEIAARLGILHQSPQVILVKNGKAIYASSHYQISLDRIKSEIHI